jgi:hypothetical protein
MSEQGGGEVDRLLHAKDFIANRLWEKHKAIFSTDAPLWYF